MLLSFACHHWWGPGLVGGTRAWRCLRAPAYSACPARKPLTGSRQIECPFFFSCSGSVLRSTPLPCVSHCHKCEASAGPCSSSLLWECVRTRQPAEDWRTDNADGHGDIQLLCCGECSIQDLHPPQLTTEREGKRGASGTRVPAAPRFQPPSRPAAAARPLTVNYMAFHDV